MSQGESSSPKAKPGLAHIGKHSKPRRALVFYDQRELSKECNARSMLSKIKLLAERGGFEPPVDFKGLRRFSKPLLSTTQPPLRVSAWIGNPLQS